MKFWKSVVAACAVAALCAGSALAAGETVLEDVVVTGERIATPTKQTRDTVYTGTEMTRKGIEMQGTKAAESVYETLGVLPGVNLESPDATNLSPEQKTVRVRGVRSSLGSMSVEGIPNYGGNPMGPRDYLYDMENMQGVALYKGAVPADIGTGVGARGGAIDLKPRWPGQTPGLEFSQSYGSNSYLRTFARVDSGKLPNLETSFSASYSYTDADKWKGPGDLGPRHNVNFMLSQPTTGKDAIHIWVNHNHQEPDLFRPLSYAQTRALKDNYTFDYNEKLTGVRAQDIYYYKYNAAKYDNTDLFAVIPVTLDSGLHLSFKPYYAKEDSRILNAPQNSIVVQQRVRDIERYGLISEVSYPFSFATASLGYMFEVANMKIITENYVPGSMSFAGYGIYTKNNDNGYVHSPYLKLAGEIGDLKWQAGLKYFYYAEPSTDGYTSSAPSYALVRAPDLDRESKTYDALLPTLGLSYAINDTFETYANYGRSQIRPYSYVPLISIYRQKQNVFQAAGVTLNDMFNGYKMEITDSIEFGTRFKTDSFEVTPSAYFTKSENLLVTVYDPRVNLNYQQNIADATGYGLEVESSFFLTDWLTFFFNPSYNVLTYDKDLTYLGRNMDTKGKQVVDTPNLMAKSGFIFKYKGFEAIPAVRYVGTRYGDAEHKEKIDDYYLLDLSMSYTVENLMAMKKLKASLEFYNLLDKRYISVINSSDDTLAGSTAYYVGAPFTVLAKVGVEF